MNDVASAWGGFLTRFSYLWKGNVMRANLMLTACVFGLAMVALAPAKADTVTLQNGLNGYSGCEDTAMYREDEEQRKRNFGAKTNLSLKYHAAGDDDKAALIRFSNLGIPAGRTISSAKLRLYAFELNYVPGAVITVSPLLVGISNYGNKVSAAADDGEVCWWERARNQAGWASGNDGPVAGSDYDDGVKVTAPIPAAANAWVEWNVTGIVQGWYSGSLTNNGLYIYADTQTGGNDYDLIPWSADYTDDTSLRPQLVIEYNSVPEPGAAMLVVSGLLALAAYAWRRRK